jgi:hypothetical protein
MNTFEQEVARNHARAIGIGRRMSGPDAAVAPAMISTRRGFLRTRARNGTVVAALASGVLRLQPVEPVELDLAGDVIELPPERIESVLTKPIETSGSDGEPFCAGLLVKVRTVDGASFELSFLDGSGELFRDHTPEACAELKTAYDAFVDWVPTVANSA